MTLYHHCIETPHSPLFCNLRAIPLSVGTSEEGSDREVVGQSILYIYGTVSSPVVLEIFKRIFLNNGGNKINGKRKGSLITQ